ncbi:hypothetical protein [Parahaliea aestuarii]|uniref:Uncharacterized protein n=1 Tax=Parahaliea aestuarii TaxID=1852021 RepID=A0A5C8ZRI0_9GAMM|nr:hypothetical protein [Parahaliea aestuarii]TXS90414.1 hypothetical protein FVW59_13805 [Parahaliea aestuarii]
MLTNKHVVIALLVAPLLSLLAWFGVGQLAGEQPRAAVAGQVYPLLEKSNCRYASGTCELVNGNVSLQLQVVRADDAPLLVLTSSVSLQGVAVAVVPAGAADGIAPSTMHSSNDDTTRWQLPLAAPLAEGDRLRLVAATAQNRFTAELSTRFSRAEVRVSR